jgi:hypothetical protein
MTPAATDPTGMEFGMEFDKVGAASRHLTAAANLLDVVR